MEHASEIRLGDLPTGSKVVFGGKIWIIDDREKTDCPDNATPLIFSMEDNYFPSNLDQWLNFNPSMLADRHQAPTSFLTMRPACNILSEVLVTKSQDESGCYAIVL